MIVATVHQTDRNCAAARQRARTMDPPESSTDDQNMLQSFLVSLARGACGLHRSATCSRCGVRLANASLEPLEQRQDAARAEAVKDVAARALFARRDFLQRCVQRVSLAKPPRSSVLIRRTRTLADPFGAASCPADFRQNDDSEPTTAKRRQRNAPAKRRQRN